MLHFPFTPLMQFDIMLSPPDVAFREEKETILLCISNKVWFGPYLGRKLVRLSSGRPEWEQRGEMPRALGLRGAVCCIPSGAP